MLTTYAAHPGLSKQGVCIDRGKYNRMRSAILKQLVVYGPMTFEELSTAVEKRLHGKFDGSIPWYFTTVKLDLEARGEIRRVPGSKPQLIALT